MSFREMFGEDMKNIFLDTENFAERHTVRYDGVTYENIPLVLTPLKQSERPVRHDDNMRGVYLVSGVAYLAASDIGGAFPEQGEKFEISDGERLGQMFFNKYSVVTSREAFGALTLELRRYDE